MGKARLFPEITLVAGFVLAVAFIFSCSSEDGKDGASCTVEPKADATGGYDVFCNDEKIGELSNGKDAECILSPKRPPKTDTMLVICNDAVAGEILNGKSCGVEDEGAHIVMKCDEEEIKLPKAMCGTVAYDPAENECSNNILYLNFTDIRDGRKYKGVTIGNQIWMTENLNYSGQPDTTLGKCYAEGVDEVSPDSIARNCAKYGRLYDWATAIGIDTSYNSKVYAGNEKKKDICPAGWHIPATEEWLTLINFVGDNAGIKLKTTRGWMEDTRRMESSVWIDGTYHTFYFYMPISGDGTDDYGFSALPGGRHCYDDYKSCYNIFVEADWCSYWWSTSEYNVNLVFGLGICYYDQDIRRRSHNKKDLLSIRCIKD